MVGIEDNTNKMFDEVQTGELGPNACSPKPPDASFKGILINAPSQVKYKPGKSVGRRAFARVPVCGYYRLSPASPPLKSTILEAMLLVAVNIETGRRYSGFMNDPDLAAPPPDRPAPSRAAVANIIVAGYFNPNLAEYVPIPAEPAIYDVHVELDSIISNVVQIRIVKGNN